MTTAARLFRTSKTKIHSVWKKENIVRIAPESGEWRRYAQRAKSPVCGWWGNADTAAMWMTQHKEVFPDWSHVWKKEQQNKKATESYNSADSQYIRACNQDIRRHALKSIYPDWSSLWSKSRMSYTPQARAKDNLRKRLKEIMGKVKKGGTEHRNNLTGCSTRQLADHLESTFKRGMTWDNYGTRWHVDHILPCASFDHTDPKQVAQCWHWTNLRALDAQKNMDKSDKITEPQMSLLLCATL
jgi:hypothetical protein